MSARGLLLVNLGSPASPRRADVRRYLQEFLTDRYVIDLPVWMRYALVYGAIAPTRAGKSGAAYAKIWRPEGSPLIHYTRAFAERVQARLAEGWDVRWAMRYGTPSIGHALDGWAVDHLYVVPMYPQYAESSTRSALEAVFGAARDAKRVSFLRDFFAAPEFIAAQAAQIERSRDAFKPDKILLSFHGLPEHHMRKLHPDHCLVTEACCAQVTERNRSCYRAQALATASALRASLGASVGQMPISFQSRLGRRPWIKPYTDHVVSQLAAEGCKRVLVSCPSFVADCLETLEEVQIRLREQFRGEGGDDLQLVPAVNAEPRWVEAFCQMVERAIWSEKL